MVSVDISSGPALSAALDEWRAALGAAHVSTASEEVRAAGTATFPTTATVGAILRPGNREDVQRCLTIANRFGVPLYPISSGKNWGYGSRAPVRDAVLLDLGRLNRIIDFSEKFAYVTLEPGVTQRQLHQFLQAQQSRLWMDATGASPDCSIIGNTLERGFGHTPMGDHCNHVCGFEVVLPSGDCVDTGFSRFPGGKVGPLSRWGTGPSVDGLFSQSNFGIVTRMTVWLMPAPDRYAAFFFQTEDGLADVVEAMRPLRLNGTIRSVSHIANDYKVLSSSGQYPWSETGGRTPLSRDTMGRMRHELRIGRWNGSGCLYGTRGQVRESRSLLRRALRGKITRLQFIDDRTLNLLRMAETPYRLITGRQDLARALLLLPPLIGLMKGIPTEEFLPSAYWRKPQPPPAKPDPDADGCGLLWCSPVAPSTGQHTSEVVDIGEDIVLKHGFEPLISVSLINERTTVSTIAITYDRRVQNEDAKAVSCYREMTEQLLARGYPPYRLNVSAMEYGRAGGPYMNLIRSLKQTLDPNGILAPGRYE
jgi:4-cresol dehydrogenase (hydroxylating)